MSYGSPEQQFNFAKTLPIPALAKVLQGQSDVVEQYIADMVLRQKINMQKAMQGQQAMAAAQQPKVVERDLAQAQQAVQPRMEQGVAGLPVGGIGEIGNYAGAGGGIVAFEDGGEVVHAFDGIYVGGQKGPQFSRATDEEMEARRLRDQIRRAYQTKASWLGGTMFTPSFGGNIAEQRQQFEQERNTAKAILENLDRLDLESLRNLTAQLQTAQPVSAASARETQITPSRQSAQVEPFRQGTPADVRRADIAAGGVNSPSMPAQAPAYIPRSMQMGDLGKDTSSTSGIAGLSTADEKLLDKLFPRPRKMTPAQAIGQQAFFDEAYGVDSGIYGRMREKLEQEAAKEPAERREAGWMRALEAGLGIMGGESPYGFVNLGKGSQTAVKGAMEDLKEFRKLGRERTKLGFELDAAENAFKRTGSTEAQRRLDAAQDRYDRNELERGKAGADIYRTMAALNAPGAEERFYRAAAKDPTLKQTILDIRSAGLDTRTDAALVQKFIAMSATEKMQLKEENPALYAMLEMKARQLAMPGLVTTPGPDATIRR